MSGVLPSFFKYFGRFYQLADSTGRSTGDWRLVDTGVPGGFVVLSWWRVGAVFAWSSPGSFRSHRTPGLLLRARAQDRTPGPARPRVVV